VIFAGLGAVMMILYLKNRMKGQGIIGEGRKENSTVEKQEIPLVGGTG
jgi:hypothetical protein